MRFESVQVDVERRPRAKRGVTVAVVFAFLAGLLVMLPEVGAQDEDFTCSVEAADGGILLSWTAVDDAATYQYKLDVDGRGSSYRRVTGTSTLIPLADGLTGTIGLAPVMADGSGPARVSCGSASPLDGTGEQTLVCSVESAAGGINVTWNDIRGAVTYAYRLDVDDRRSRYQRMTGTSTFIGLPAGVTGTVAMTPVFADGSTRPRVLCGSAAALDGTGTIDLTCSVVSDPGGVKVSWNDVPGAVTFGYRLRVEGRGDSYGRINGRSAVIAVDEGALATIGMNPVAADGSTVARVNCGSAVGGGDGDTSDPLTIATCASSADGSDVVYAWSVDGDTDDFSNYRINYSVERPGAGFAEVARSFDVADRSYRIALQPGDVVTSTIQVTYNDQTRSAAVDCGTTTIPVVAVDPLTVVSCTSTDDGADINYAWTVEGDPADFGNYRINYSVDRGRGAGFAEVSRIFDVAARGESIGLRLGDVVTSTIQVTYNDQTRSAEVPCGTITIGGVPFGPECTAFTSPLRFSYIPGAEFQRITLSSDDGEVRTVDVTDNTPLEVTGEPGSVIDVSIQAFFADGSTTLNTACGSIRIPDAPVEPVAPVITSCSSVDTGDGVRIDFTVDGDTEGINYAIRYEVVVDPFLSFSEVAREFDAEARNYFIALQVGNQVTANITIEGGGDGTAVDCGGVTIGGNQA